LKSGSKPSLKPRLALLQYSLGKDPIKNWQKMLPHLQAILKSKPHVVVFPEMFLGTVTKLSQRRILAKFYHHCEQQLAILAVKHGCCFFYSLLEAQRGKFYNTAHWMDTTGAVSWSYRKMHLFSYGGETKIYSRGHSLRPFSTPFGICGGVICYDLRFPEMMRYLAAQGVHLLFVSAQWPQSRMSHWITLIRARAIENQMFVVAANRFGTSLIVDPWGDIILELPSTKKYGYAVLDLKYLKSLRRKYPFLREKRFFL